MNSRETVLANLNHDGPDRCGLNFDCGRLDDMLIVGVGLYIDNSKPKWTEGNHEFYSDEWGNVWVRMIGGCQKGEIHQEVLTSWDKLGSMEVPDFEDEGKFAEMKNIFANCHDKFKVAMIGGWIFDNARYLRKMENYFMDMVMYPDELRKLHSIVCRVYEAKIHGAGRSGADAIFIGEDMGTQNGLLFAPEMFRDYFKADYTRLMGIAHDYGMKVMLHSCGQNWEILDDLIDAGVDCFQFDQPAVYDMLKLAKKFRERKVAIWAPVDIQKVLPTGDKQYIQEQTRVMLEIFEGFLITKSYPDLPGIGVKKEWDIWAYETILGFPGI